jgi:hypothetical protein
LTCRFRERLDLCGVNTLVARRRRPERRRDWLWAAKHVKSLFKARKH